jgi:aspartate aminotransferase
VLPPPLAKRLSTVQPSATLAISERAAQMRSQGIDVISFGVGEPDFATPAHIREAAKVALDRGATKYTAVRGITALIGAILEDSERRRGVAHRPRQVVVSTGAKQSLFNLALALFQEGDEVIIPAPYWVSYPEQVALVGATPKIVPTTEESGFLLTPAALRAAIGPRTRGVILCSPSNPTGSAYSEEQLAALAEVLRDAPIWVIVDEMYGQLVYDGFQQASLAKVAPYLADRLILIDGASKTYAMTGWRIGWMLAPEAVADACELVQGQSTSNAAAVCQYATIAALKGDRTELHAMVAEFGARRNAMVEGLRGIDGLTCRMPEGAFYAFPSVGQLVGRQTPTGTTLTSDVDVATHLLETARVAVVPGTAFGGPGYVRLSYATSREQIAEGIARMSAAIAALR